MGRFVARLLTATVLGIWLLASQSGPASASESAKASNRAAGQAGIAVVSGRPHIPQAPQPGTAIVPGFDSQTYGPNDDGSAPCIGPDAGTPQDCTPAPIPLPFPINFYGTEYSSLYLNNNGNLTFGSPLSDFTPESLNQIDLPMIAPFWADVDTRTGPVVSYGEGTVGGHLAFGVNYLSVGCFSEIDSVADTFQVLLIQRSDMGTGDWDIEFNYGPLTWESGQASGGDDQCLNGTPARAGYTSGAGVSCELDGSGDSGALLSDDLDTGLSNNSFNSSVLGRYVFHVAGHIGAPDGCSQYWALGDSYSSGEGTGLYNLAGEKCNRSTLGWPEDLSAGFPAVPPITPTTYVACSGDDTDMILHGQPTYEPVSQADQLRNWAQSHGEPGLVTATGGGNDSQVDFSGILTACVIWGTLKLPSRCVHDVKAETAKLANGSFTPILRNYYSQIVLAAQGEATTAQSGSDPDVVIVGYPNLFPAPSNANATEAKQACPWLGSSALAALQAFADGQSELNAVMSTAASEAGVRFAELGDVLAGHELCTADPYILALTRANKRHAGHPNAKAQQLMAAQVASDLGYLPGQGTTPGAQHPTARRAAQPKRPGEGKRETTRTTTSRSIAGTRTARHDSAIRVAPATGVKLSAGVTLSGTLLQGGVGVPYDGYLSATGGTGPYTFAVTGGSLPDGLTLDPSGVITGTPTAVGNSTFTVTATDSSSSPKTGSASETIDVISTGTLAVTTSSLPSPTVGQEYDATLAASGGLPDYTWAVTSGNLPNGLSLDASTGEITGQPTTSGPSTFTVQATDGSTPTAQTATGTITITVTAATAALATVATTLPGASMGDTYDQTLASTGGTGPVSWSVESGNLPTGLSLDPATGEITGIASEAGTFAFSALVQDAAAHTATEDLSITIATGTAPAIDTTTLPDGTQGTAYHQIVTAQDGVAPYTWSVTSGSLPTGLSLDTSTGKITGKPTASGSFTFAVTASDSAATTQTATQSLSLTIAAAPPPPAMSVTDTVTDGTVGDAYNASLIPANGAQPYTYAVTSGALPAGLSLDPNFGIISGTPTATGTSNATITVTDSSTPTAQTSTDSVSITITAPVPLAVSTTSLQDGAVGAPYATPVAVTGGTGADTFAVTSGSLPDGLAIDPATGIINGTPTTTGTSSFTVMVTDSATPTAGTATANLTLTIDAATPVSIATTGLPDAQQGVAYSQILAANGGAPPYTWAVTSGSLPDGLSLDPSTGVVSGIPTGSGASTFTVQATDSLTPTAQSATESLTLTVDPAAPLGVTTTTLPEATVGASYSSTLDGSGGTTPYTWSVSSGSLPDGLILDPNEGIIGGTPTNAGTFSFTVEATDSSTPTAQTATQALMITVGPAPLTPQSISFTAPSSGVVGGSATLSATGGGSGNPVVFSTDATSGTGVCSVTGTTVSYTAVGSCVIDANQAGNASFAAAPQVQQTIAVGKEGATSKLSLSASSIRFGHEKSLVVTVKVTPRNPGPLPSGTITIKVGKITLCKAKALSRGKATCSPRTGKTLPVGKYRVVATYSGGTNWTSATSNAVTLKVTRT